MKTSPDAHDYTRRQRRWGHDIVIDKVVRGGKKIEAYGWGDGLKEGDFVLLSNAGDATTRYRIKKIRYSTSVYDLFYATLWFAPRSAHSGKPKWFHWTMRSSTKRLGDACADRHGS